MHELMASMRIGGRADRTQMHRPWARSVRGAVAGVRLRYTNTSNHRTVVRDATGSIRVYFQPDGTKISQFHGHNALPVRAANTGFPGGDYITHGDFVVVVHPDRVREIPVQLGTMENLCETLA
jgi:hypothetical protein